MNTTIKYKRAQQEFDYIVDYIWSQPNKEGTNVGIAEQMSIDWERSCSSQRIRRFTELLVERGYVSVRTGGSRRKPLKFFKVAVKLSAEQVKEELAQSAQ